MDSESIQMSTMQLFRLLDWPASMQGDDVSRDPDNPSPIPAHLTQPIPMGATPSQIAELIDALRAYLRTVYTEIGFFKHVLRDTSKRLSKWKLQLLERELLACRGIPFPEEMRQRLSHGVSVFQQRSTVELKWLKISEERAQWCRARLALLKPDLHLEDAPLPSELSQLLDS